MKRSILLLILSLVCLSCVSLKDTVESEQPLLPLGSGWYQYDFERTLKGIEVEYNFFASTGMQMIYEVTWKYNGVVCRFEDGVLYDPVSELELSIDSEGIISCVENISIKGEIGNNGRFFWSGTVEEHEQLNTIFVKGQLTPLPPGARGGREYDGVYSLRDTGTGREQIANISGGFYTWQYLDGEAAGFDPWPTLIHPDGSFSFSVEITTVAEMGNISSANTSARFTSEGKVIPGQGITLEELTRTSAQGIDQAGAPQIYAGTAIRSGEYPNEEIPADIESLVESGRAAVKAEPKPNPAVYPPWYLKLPVKAGFIYAAGEKTFGNRETAFAMAEAAAAANIAEQLLVKMESELTTSDSKRMSEERIKSETLQRLNYRVIEKSYNEEKGTAFVLAEYELGS